MTARIAAMTLTPPGAQHNGNYRGTIHFRPNASQPGCGG
jgi:hypothetical protein